RIDHGPTGTSTTYYQSGIYEKVVSDTGKIQHKHYIADVAIITKTENAGTDNGINVNYFHRDHLNSLTAITDQNGQVVERFSYDPWGKRRQTDWQAAIDFTQITSTITKRGFTNHEHLDGVGLIHMNGRVYDPNVGRFLSADPVIQYPDDLQSFNRYSYVRNNPLNAYDPTGFSECKPDSNGNGCDDSGGNKGGGRSRGSDRGKGWNEEKQCYDDYYDNDLETVVHYMRNSCADKGSDDYSSPGNNRNDVAYSPGGSSSNQSPTSSPSNRPGGSEGPRSTGGVTSGRMTGGSKSNTIGGGALFGSMLIAGGLYNLGDPNAYANIARSQGGSAYSTYSAINSSKYFAAAATVFIAVKSAKGALKGGRYGKVRYANVGGEVHHMPANSVNGLRHSQGPAIHMPTVDHRQTASHGHQGLAGAEYRAKQKELIDAGRFDDAIQMDIDDIQTKFGNKYDDAILQMIDSLD
ncbi:RHS repeat domain-containing protein, partial [Zooshikella sp. RANM57]|uniref:RHS repeat domain-containing protein n=1 Tax=Zooshikella sp. RANM57 TaxID=3425863 RepID=UPI003D6F18EF